MAAPPRWDTISGILILYPVFTQGALGLGSLLLAGQGQLPPGGGVWQQVPQGQCQRHLWLECDNKLLKVAPHSRMSDNIRYNRANKERSLWMECTREAFLYRLSPYNHRCLRRVITGPSLRPASRASEWAWQHGGGGKLLLSCHQAVTAVMPGSASSSPWCLGVQPSCLASTVTWTWRGDVNRSLINISRRILTRICPGNWRSWEGANNPII